jgi:hypothetical protein
MKYTDKNYMKDYIKSLKIKLGDVSGQYHVDWVCDYGQKVTIGEIYLGEPRYPHCETWGGQKRLSWKEMCQLNERYGGCTERWRGTASLPTKEEAEKYREHLIEGSLPVPWR